MGVKLGFAMGWPMRLVNIPCAHSRTETAVVIAVRIYGDRQLSDTRPCPHLYRCELVLFPLTYAPNTCTVRRVVNAAVAVADDTAGNRHA
jgi:hypothetical protein